MFRGALLGEACGDALGYPLAALSVGTIERKFGPYGLRTLVRSKQAGKLAPVTDNTQLALATVDGLLWADAKKLDYTEGIYRGCMRWFYSQTGEEPRRGQRTWMRRQPHEREFCLVREKFMHARRDPEAGLLKTFSMELRGTTKSKVNESSGSAVLSRAVPIGLLYSGDEKEAFELGVRAGALSHSGPVAYYAAGALAAIISCLASGVSLPKSIERAHGLLSKVHKVDSIVTLLGAAEQQAASHPAGKEHSWAHIDAISSLGTGEAADEALAIGIYCALAVDDPMDSIIVAANHDGKSHTTAAITGAIQGLRFGPSFLPAYWTGVLEGERMIIAIADKLHHMREKKLLRDKKK